MKGNGEDRDADNAGQETPEEVIELHDSELQEIPEQEIARLRAELEEKTKNGQENYDKYLRACADLDNYRKRAAKEKADAISFANEGFIEEPSVIDMDRPSTQRRTQPNRSAPARLTMDQMYALLKIRARRRQVSRRGSTRPHHAISEEESSRAGSVVRSSRTLSEGQAAPASL